MYMHVYACTYVYLISHFPKAWSASGDPLYTLHFLFLTHTLQGSEPLYLITCVYSNRVGVQSKCSLSVGVLPPAALITNGNKESIVSHFAHA